MFGWKDEYSVNISEIDRQHMKLFEICARIYDISKLDKEIDYYDDIIEIISELHDYTEYHFNYEEELLKNNDYEELEEQHFQHIFFVKKLKKLAAKDIDEDQRKSAAEISLFLANWITDHILKSDMKYKEVLNAKGIC